MREINLRRHVAVLIIVALVFVLGVFIGMRQGLDAVGTLSQQYESISVSSAMMDTVFLMENSDMNVTESCKSYSYLFDRYNSDLAEFNSRMWEMEVRLGKQDPSLLSLKDKFNTLEVRNFLLLRKVDQLCGANHTVILYFYSNRNYDPNRDEGAVIQEAIKDIKNHTIVYHFDIAARNPAVDLLLRHYRIDIVPSMVVNEKTNSGYQNPGEVMKIVGQMPAGENATAP